MEWISAPFVRDYNHVYVTNDHQYFFPGKGKQSRTTQRELKFLYSYMMLSLDERKQIGHQRQDFIKGCTFGGLECTVDTR